MNDMCTTQKSLLSPLCLLLPFHFSLSTAHFLPPQFYFNLPFPTFPSRPAVMSVRPCTRPLIISVLFFFLVHYYTLVTHRFFGLVYDFFLHLVSLTSAKHRFQCPMMQEVLPMPPQIVM
jgi:hypothetical protein